MPNYKKVKNQNQHGCIVGGILRHGKGHYSFKLIFEDLDIARKYKDMLYFILKNDKVLEQVNIGYFDDKEKEYYD